MTDIELSALETAAKFAAPGPWREEELYPDRSVGPMQVIASNDRVVADCGYSTDSFYIAAANPAVVLSLIAELRQVKLRCTQLSKERIYLAKCLEYNNGPDMRVSAYEYIARAKEATRND